MYDTLCTRFTQLNFFCTQQCNIPDTSQHTVYGRKLLNQRSRCKCELFQKNPHQHSLDMTNTFFSFTSPKISTTVGMLLISEFGIILLSASPPQQTYCNVSCIYTHLKQFQALNIILTHIVIFLCSIQNCVINWKYSRHNALYPTSFKLIGTHYRVCILSFINVKGQVDKFPY